MKCEDVQAWRTFTNKDIYSWIFHGDLKWWETHIDIYMDTYLQLFDITM